MNLILLRGSLYVNIMCIVWSIKWVMQVTTGDLMLRSNSIHDVLIALDFYDIITIMVEDRLLVYCVQKEFLAITVAVGMKQCKFPIRKCHFDVALFTLHSFRHNLTTILWLLFHFLLKSLFELGPRCGDPVLWNNKNNVKTECKLIVKVSLVNKRQILSILMS